MYILEKVCEDMDWIHRAWDKQALVNSNEPSAFMKDRNLLSS
jgi:hypothetical protein